jgi:5-methylcytosine-specific restriction protein A
MAGKRRKRAPVLGICAKPGCPEFASARGKSYCAEHTPEPWSNARERRGKTGNSRTIHLKVLKRHRHICHVCCLPGATEVDHVIPLSRGGTNDESNLRPIHASPCHRDKTRREAQEARRARRTGMG